MKHIKTKTNLMRAISIGVVFLAGGNAYAETIIPKTGEPFREDYIFTDAQRFEQNLKVTYFYSQRCGAYNTSVKSDYEMTMTRSWYKENGVLKFTNAGNKKWAVDENYTWNGRKMYNSQADILNDTYDEVGQAPEVGTEGDGWEIATACHNNLPTITNTMLGPKTTPAVIPPAVTTNGSDSVSGGCGAGQTGTKTVYRKFVHLTNGQNYPNYQFVATKYENTCAPLSKEQKQETRYDVCPDGQIGSISMIRTWDLYSDGTIANQSAWSVQANNCTTPPKETSVKKTQEISCDSFYGAPSGTYSGKVTQSGTLTTITDFAAGTTRSTFNVESQDASSCSQMFSETTENKSTENCPDGQTGSITKVVYTAKNSKGETTYPFGSTPSVLANTCAGSSNEISGSEGSTGSAEKAAVLSNMSYKLSQLSSNGTELANAIAGFDSSMADDTHTLNIVADTMSANTLNAANVTKVVRAFKQASGDNTVNIKVGAISRNLVDYIGQNGLTIDRIKKEKLVLMSADESDGVVNVEYKSYLNQMKPGDKQKFSVKLYDL